MIDLMAQEPFLFKWQVAVAQMAGFVIFFLIMKFWLFDRLLGFIRRRNEELAEAGRRIAAARRQVEALAAEYRAKQAEADKAAYEAMQRVVKQGVAEKASVLAAAQETGRRIVDEARRTVAAEKEEALRTLDARILSLAEEIAAAAAGRSPKADAVS
jgi:F-type H+-transporting ATPase subunit b